MLPPRPLMALVLASVSLPGCGAMPHAPLRGTSADTDVADTDAEVAVAVHIAPAAPLWSDDLHCVAVPALPAAATFTWTQDGHVVADSEQTLDDLHQAGGQRWTCTLAWTDATGDHEVSSLPVTIVPPVPLAFLPHGSFDMFTKNPWEEGVERVPTTLSHDFFLGATEVTQEQFTRWGGRAAPAFPPDCLTCAVYWMSWSDAAVFANGLSAADGLVPCYPNCSVEPDGANHCTPPTTIYTCPGYRLPTDAEWEYAAREAGTHEDYLPARGNFLIPGELELNTGTYPTSDLPIRDGLSSSGAFVGDQCWYRLSHNIPAADHDHNRPGPYPVGQLIPNAFGLYDMCGNAPEYVEDQLHLLPLGGVDPLTENGSTARLSRGTSYQTSPESSTIYYHIGSGPLVLPSAVGFRIARTVNP